MKLGIYLFAMLCKWKIQSLFVSSGSTRDTLDTFKPRCRLKRRPNELTWVIVTLLKQCWGRRMTVRNLFGFTAPTQTSTF